MLKKIGLTFLCACATSSISTALYAYVQTIKAGQQIVLINYFNPRGSSGQCTVHMEQGKTTDMVATVTKPTITMDGKEVKPNESVTRTVKEASVFKIKATFRAAVVLKNSGAHDISAVCVSD